MRNTLRGIFWKTKGLVMNFILVMKYLRTINKLLQKSNICKLRIFRFFDWHDGQIYFSGSLQSNSVFIKIDLITECQTNEIVANKILSPYLPNNLLKIYNYNSIKGVSALTVEFVAGASSTVFQGHHALTRASEMVKILQIINDAGIIHRDIREDNFLIAEDGTLKLIDFTFCADLGMSHNFIKPNAGPDFQAGINKFLGGSERAGSDYWNDFASAYKIFEKNGMDADNIFKQLGYNDLDRLMSKESKFSLTID